MRTITTLNDIENVLHSLNIRWFKVITTSEKFGEIIIEIPKFYYFFKIRKFLRFVKHYIPLAVYIKIERTY